jgi:hypothetical protein
MTLSYLQTPSTLKKEMTMTYIRYCTSSFWRMNNLKGNLLNSTINRNLNVYEKVLQEVRQRTNNKWVEEYVPIPPKVNHWSREKTKIILTTWMGLEFLWTGKFELSRSTLNFFATLLKSDETHCGESGPLQSKNIQLKQDQSDRISDLGHCVTWKTTFSKLTNLMNLNIKQI